MNAFFRGCLSALLVLMPALAHAGHSRSVCVKPHCAPPVIKHVAAPVIPPVQHHTIQYVNTYNYTQLPAQQGTTEYDRYPVNYANTDLALQALAVSVGRYADNGATLGAHVTGSISEAHGNNAKLLQITETRNKAIALERLSVAIQPTATVGTFAAQATAQAGPAPAPGVLAQTQTTQAAVFAARCAGCHDQANAATKGGAAVIFQDFGQLSPEQRKVIRDRITTHSPEKRMPKGGALTDDELAAMLDVLCK